MSFIVHDLYCATCEEFERSVLYRRSDGRPGCPVCSSDRRVAWLDPPRIKPDWTPIETATGIIETRAQFDKMIAKKRRENPGKELVVSGNTAAACKVRSEEARHRSVTNLRSKGYCESDIRERKSEIKAKKLEKLARK